MNKIQERLTALRQQMKLAGVSAFYISGTDPHQSEYVPERWQSRSFISGFSGSAALVVVTLNEAALWTDSRYFLQAQNELEGTGIQLMKQRIAGTPSPAEWLGAILNENEQVGVDASCISIEQFENLQNELLVSQVQLRAVNDLLDLVWEDRPALPGNPVFEHEIQFAADSRQDKFGQIRDYLKQKGSDYLLITALDELAWTFNLRGADVEFNPVFVGFALIGIDAAYLFVEDQKVNANLKSSLEKDGIQLFDYHEIHSFLKKLDGSVWLDAAKTNQQLWNSLAASSPILRQLSCVAELKAVKSEKEIANIRSAMRKDGAAMLNFLYWLNQTVGKHDFSEFDIANKLEELRSEQANFKGNSFFPIVGYREHGAVVHYRVTEDSAKQIHSKGFLLVDSGGQYLDGTTDITRTIALGEISAEEKRDFTLVLKGMIALSMAVFPEGTKGCNLDLLARKALWEDGKNYGHGTGHGVGYFLNVHEGPMSIRQEFNKHAIVPGMILSNEPGFYKDGEYGIRTENLIVCVEKGTTEFGRFLGFDTLTLCPIDLNAIEFDLLDKSESQWLNNYHRQVYDEIAPMMDEEKLEFLKELTRPLKA